jgi:hypothetical protein
LAGIIIPAAILRVEAALFDKRATATVHTLSALEVGVTSKIDVVARIHALGLETRQYGPPVCFDEECISVVIPNSHISNALFLPLSRLQISPVHWVLTRWGLHFSSLYADVRFTSDKVSFFSYELMLSTSRVGVGRDATIIRVTSQPNLLGRSEGAAYRFTTPSVWPDSNVSIAVTPDASQELKDRAFDVNLHCLWSVSGCETWRDVLPHIQPD